MCVGTRGRQKSVGAHGSGIPGSCESPCVGEREMNSGSLREQLMLLAAGPALQSSRLCL